MKIKVIFYFVTACLLTSICGNSCKELDPVEMLGKNEYRSFLHNESGMAVELSYSLYDSVHQYKLAKDEVKQIYDTDRWRLESHGPEIKDLVFCFEDGSTYTQYCEGDNRFALTYYPKENNIFCFDNNPETGWILTKVGTNQYDYIYYIRKPKQ